MSQAGRYAHEQNQKRHNQGKSSGVMLMGDTIETATWLQGTMEFCRHMARHYDNMWNIDQFVEATSPDEELTAAEAERRLRYLSKLGFLRMSASWSGGSFGGYWFRMDNPSLPR